MPRTALHVMAPKKLTLYYYYYYYYYYIYGNRTAYHRPIY